MGRLAKNVGENIRRYRKAAKLTQRALGRKAGIDPKSLSRIETGHRLPGLDLLARLSGHLGIELPVLVDFDDAGSGRVTEHHEMMGLERLAVVDRDLVMGIVRSLVDHLSVRRR